MIAAFCEHPEDLGRVGKRDANKQDMDIKIPASIWQDERFLLLKGRGWWSGAFKQC